jgi:hypothetical protein
MEAITPTATQNASEPVESAEAQAPATGPKVMFDGQEMEIDAFLKSRKHKTKVDGKEVELDYDELTRGYGHTKAANARMQEAAEMRKAAEAAQKREKALMDSIYGWKQDPTKAFEALEQLGIDVDSISHDRVLKKMAYEMMSEQEREAFDAKRELEKYKAREAKEAEERRKQELDTLKQQAATDLEQGILKFLEGNPNKVSPSLVGRAIDAMIYAAEGGQEISIEEAFNRAGAWYERERKQIFENELQALIGSGEVPKPLAEAVRKADIAALRKEPPKRQAPEAPKAKKEPAGIDDFFNSLEKRYRK